MAATPRVFPRSHARRSWDHRRRRRRALRAGSAFVAVLASALVVAVMLSLRLPAPLARTGTPSADLLPPASPPAERPSFEIAHASHSGTGDMPRTLLRADQTLILATQRGQLLSVDPETLATRWSMPLGMATASGEPAISTAVLAGEMLYAGTNDGMLHAIDIETGVEQWQFYADRSITAGPVLGHDGWLVFGTGSGAVYALDTSAEGGVRWTFVADDVVTNLVALPDGSIAGADASGALFQLHGDSGEPGWHRASTGAVISDLAGGPNAVFAAFTDGLVLALDPMTGSEAWRYGLDPAAGSIVLTVTDARLIVSQESAGMTALDPTAGYTQWVARQIVPGLSRPVVNHAVIYAADGADIVVLSLASGEVLDRIPGASGYRCCLALSDGAIYAASADGTLTRITTS